jgi:isopenicillin-N N-acyltransferase like protein
MFSAVHQIKEFKNEIVSTHEKKTPRLEYFNTFPLLHLYGTPYEMGYQYGTILKDQLNSLIVLVSDIFPKRKIDEYIAMGKMVEGNLPENLRAELNGMVDGSGIEFSKLLALNLIPKVTCSTLAVWGKGTADGNVIMGRNADFFLKKINKALGLIVVKHPTNGYATISITFMGLLGAYTGMNETGLSYGNMLVYNGLTDSVGMEGLPIHLLMQLGGQNNSTAQSMSNFLMSEKHMIPINMMCADSNEAIVVELSPYQCAMRKDSKGVLAATNHFVSSGMFKETVLCERFQSLMFCAKKNYGKFDLDDMKEAMYLARQPGKNLQCVLFEPAKYKMYLSMNKIPASEGPFYEIDIRELFDN